MENQWIVDQLGLLKAQLSDLTIQYNNLKSLLEDQGNGAYEGKMFRATVSTFERNTLDMDAVREHLSYQFIAAHTETKEVTKVCVVARTAKDQLVVPTMVTDRATESAHNL